MTTTATNDDAPNTTREPDIRNCKRCDGLGTVFHKGFTSLEGKVYPDRTDVCNGCRGEKTFAAPDVRSILQQIIVKQGKNKGNLKSGWAGNEHYKSHDAARAYYVWRMARFHGGVDTKLPMTATMVIRSDSWTVELDKIADEVAKLTLGTDMAGAIRWGRAFGII